MNDEQRPLTQEPQEERISDANSDLIQNSAENETPTDLLARLHQAGDSRSEPDNEDG